MSARHTRGIVYMLIAVAILAVLDVLLKMLSAHYPAMEVAALRGAASVPFVLVTLMLQGRLGNIRARRWSLHILRAALGVVMMASFIYALHGASLSNTYTLFMVAPLLVTAFAVPFLKERVTFDGWIAVSVGLLGAVCVLRPSGQGVSLIVATAALGSAFCYAVLYVLGRHMIKTESTESLLIWYLVLLGLFCGALAWHNWQPILRSDWLLIAALGLSGAIGQLFFTRAMVYAPASIVAPFDYTALLWGALFDWLIWSVTEPAATLIGALLIVSSGIYIMLRAHRMADPEHEIIPATLPSEPPI
jgi:drug/metabolite transporter (DMT)-like permease